MAAALGLLSAFLTGGAVTASAAGGLDMHTEYPGLTAKAGEDLTFDLGFDNSGAGCDASLSIQSMPEGWEGYIAGSGNRISSIHIPSGIDTADAVFQLQIPADTADGEYQVVLEARAGDAVYDTLTLTLNVSELEVSQGDFSSEYPEQEGSAGTAFSFNATLINNSATDQSYSLSAEAPDGWQVSFTPSGEILFGRAAGATAATLRDCLDYLYRKTSAPDRQTYQTAGAPYVDQKDFAIPVLPE